MKQTQKGYYEITVFRKDGSVKDQEVVENTITNIGISKQNELAFGSATAKFDYIAVGTNNSAPGATQTELGDEITSGGLSRAQGTFSLHTETNNNDTAQVEHTFTASADQTVEEVGLFNDATTGDMFSRVQSTKQVDNGEELRVRYRVVNTTNA